MLDLGKKRPAINLVQQTSVTSRQSPCVHNMRFLGRANIDAQLVKLHNAVLGSRNYGCSSLLRVFLCTFMGRHFQCTRINSNHQNRLILIHVHIPTSFSVTTFTKSSISSVLKWLKSQQRFDPFHRCVSGIKKLNSSTQCRSTSQKKRREESVINNDKKVHKNLNSSKIKNNIPKRTTGLTINF